MQIKLVLHVFQQLGGQVQRAALVFLLMQAQIHVWVTVKKHHACPFTATSGTQKCTLAVSRRVTHEWWLHYSETPEEAETRQMSLSRGEVFCVPAAAHCTCFIRVERTSVRMTTDWSPQPLGKADTFSRMTFEACKVKKKNIYCSSTLTMQKHKLQYWSIANTANSCIHFSLVLTTFSTTKQHVWICSFTLCI